MLEYSVQLADDETGKLATDAGAYYVVTAGTPSRISIYDATDTVKNNPGTIVAGNIYFRTAESVTSVDVYGLTDKGYGVLIKGLKPGAQSMYNIRRTQLDQTIIIPFDIAAAPAAVIPALAANTEFMSGFKLASRQSIQPLSSGVLVTALDAGITIDVGNNSTSGSDDPDGLFDGLSLAALGMINSQVGYAVGTNSILVDVTGGTAEWTMGELFHPATTKSASKAEGTDSATTKNGIYFLKNHVAGVGSGTTWEEITFTLASSADTAAGFIVLASRVNPANI